MVDREMSQCLNDLILCFNLVIEILMVDREKRILCHFMKDKFQSRNRDSYG